MKKLLLAFLLLIGLPALAVDTTFVPNQTVISAQFMNDVNVSMNRSVINAQLSPYSAKCDGITDDTVAIQAAITAAAAKKGILFFPPGTCLVSSTLVLQNNVRYVGAGKKATVIYSTCACDALQINNPSNSSTQANISIEDMYVQSVTRTVGKAGLADNGSSYLWIKRSQFAGNNYGIILDQTEIAAIEESEFETTGNAADAGIWLVNGASRTIGNALGYTNRITIAKNQFNGVAGIGVADDGGAMHAITNNNFNALTHQIRFANTSSAVVDKNEMENFTGTSIIYLAATVLQGGASGQAAYNLTVKDNWFATGGTTNVIKWDTGQAATQNLEISNNSWNTPAGGFEYSSAPAFNIARQHFIARGNWQASVGSTALNNYGVLAYTPVITATGANPTVGNSTFVGSATRAAGEVSFQLWLSLGSTWSGGTGNYQFSIPLKSFDNGTGYLRSNGVGLVTKGGNYSMAVAFIFTGSDKVLLLQGGGTSTQWSSTDALASGDSIAINITYYVGQYLLN
jgi:hypothetical protein